MSGEQRKAVIKNADMEDKMQQDAVDTASKALSEFNIEKVRKCDCTITSAALCSQTHPAALLRTLPHTSRRNLTESMVPPGMLLLDEISGVMLRTRQSILSIFI
jgi:hypothetical protein